MNTLFNDNWEFSELPLDYNSMYKDGNPVLFNPQDFYSQANSLKYSPVQLPHDWMIWHVKDLYKNSVGCYKKQFNLSKDQIQNRHLALRFEGVYMNSAVWVNGSLAGEWKYGYSTFEFDISAFVKEGINTVQVLAVYQHCNTRWYSGAGIFRDVTLINTPQSFLVTDGTYIVTKASNNDGKGKWQLTITTEVANLKAGQYVKTTIWDQTGKNLMFENPQVKAIPTSLSADDEEYLHNTVSGIKNYKLSVATENFTIENPNLWDIDSPYFYISKTQLFNEAGEILDCIEQHCGFKTSIFDSNKGYFLNGRHIKLYGACQHHDQGALGAAFDVNALRRQFNVLKDMGVNSVRCSHNPPPKAWMDLADEMGLLIDDEAFDMWEKPKTQFDYGNYFNEWCQKDIASWVRKDRNHPCLLMWSIGNEIYDTHMGRGFEITKELSSYVQKHDPQKVAPITIASNYMMTEGAQNCATQIDTVGYNYLERLYNEHHQKNPDWKIYGSETSSTVQSRGIYHFPDELKLVTFSDGQCSTLGNCTTTWGCANTQTVIANDRDCPFSAGQYIWTAWDYIGEPTPYHTKNSYFGQIDTAGFPKDTYFLYKSEWAYKNTKPFVHLLPYWDWNEGQIIDVKAYTNADSIELFFNGKSLGKQAINHVNGKEPFGKWKLPYAKGEVKAVGYDENNNQIACDIKRSFEDPASIILEGETKPTGNLFFIDVMTADKNGTLVENARNYITIQVSGDAELVGMDNGDSTDYDEYKPADGKIHSRKLFSNRLVAIVKAKSTTSEFTVTAASKDLPNTTIKYTGLDKDGNNSFTTVTPDNSVKPQMDFVPARKIEIIAEGSPNMNAGNKQINITAKVLPLNASIKQINWNPVLKECVSSDYIEVTQIQGQNSGIEKAVIKANCDGECILRCTAQNGSTLDEIISDLNFTVEGVGNPKLNPYKLIEGCRLCGWDKTKDKPTVSLESGIANRGIGATYVAFDKVDFGKDGADTIHLPIFSFDTQLPVEVWDGKPDENGTCLGKFTYQHESIYNTFSDNVFTLEKRLFGVHTISIYFHTELVFHGFYFDKTPKAFAKLRALDANDVIGDTFTKTPSAVEGIGNNVNLDFADMNFDKEKATKLTICGKSNTNNNTINLKFFDEDGSSSTQIIEFSHTNDYEEKTFTITPVTGNKKVSFIFLPGCNFDFKWFKFE